MGWKQSTTNEENNDNVKKKGDLQIVNRFPVVGHKIIYIKDKFVIQSPTLQRSSVHPQDAKLVNVLVI